MLDGVTHFGISTEIEVLFSPRLYMLRNCPEELYFCWLNQKSPLTFVFPLDGKIALRKQEHLYPLKLKSKCLLHFVNILVYWKCVLKNDKSWRKFLSTRWKPLVWYPFIAPFTEKNQDKPLTSRCERRSFPSIDFADQKKFVRKNKINDFTKCSLTRIILLICPLPVPWT